MRLRLTLALALLVPGLSACNDDAPASKHAVVLLLPTDADEASVRVAAATVDYLEAMTGEAPLLITGDFASLAELDAEARRAGAALTIVLDGERAAPEIFDAARMQALGAEGFALEAVDRGSFSNVLGSEGTTMILAAGNSRLAHQYGAYEILRRLGARFYHPEQEFVPVIPAEQLRDRAKTPTVLGREGQDYLPDFASRSWSFHGAHPLEHLEAFSDGDHPIDEAVHVNDWIIKNMGDRFRGAGRGVASDEARARRVAELEDLRVLLGFPRGPGISLHNQQQGASADIDPSSGVPVQQQIEDLVAARLGEAEDAEWFGIHFGPTEVTTTPDQETVQWIDWAGQAALDLRPDLRVWINDHITGSQPSPNYDDLGCGNGTNDQGLIDYYDLAFHSDPRLGVTVHTVMFYPLEGPARVYEQDSFAHKLCLMQQASAAGRPLNWFPEGSWWLSFDNPIPVYLPLHIWTRARDVELVRPLLQKHGGTLEGHRMFNSGQEWGYWQQDYAVGLLGFNSELGVPAILGELFDPLCEVDAWPASCPARDEAIAVLTEVMDQQRAMFLDAEDWAGRPGGLYAYFAGEDQADRIAAEVGFEFRPVRVDFAEVLTWEQDDIDHFRAGDGAALADAAAAYAGWRTRLEALSVPEAGQPWLDEVVDGVAINEQRAAQAHHLYASVLAYREAGLAGGGPGEQTAAAVDDWIAAHVALTTAEQIIRRREAAYRYPDAQMFGGGLTPETAVDNGTTYPYRVHTKTHLLTYWHNRDDEVLTILMGGSLEQAAAITIGEAIDLPGQDLSIDWGEADPDSALTIGAVASIDPTTTALALPAGDGYYAVSGELIIDGQPLPISGGVARAEVLAATPAGGLMATVPMDPLAQNILASVFPAMRWAWVASGEGAPALGFAADVDEDGSVPFDAVTRAPATVMGESFVTAPISYRLPIASSSGGSRLEVGVSQMVLAGTITGGVVQSPLQLTGDLSLPDLVAALIELAGFDEDGAYQTLAPILGFDPADPPATVAVAADVTVE